MLAVTFFWKWARIKIRGELICESLRSAAPKHVKRGKNRENLPLVQTDG